MRTKTLQGLSTKQQMKSGECRRISSPEKSCTINHNLNAIPSKKNYSPNRLVKTEKVLGLSQRLKHRIVHQAHYRIPIIAIKILLKFFSFGRYASACAMFEQIRTNPQLMVKDEYSTFKNMITVAYYGFVETDKSQQPLQMAPIMSGQEQGNPCSDCGRLDNQGGYWCIKSNPEPSRSETPCQWFTTKGRDCWYPDTCPLSCIFRRKKIPLPIKINLTSMPQ